MKILKPDGAIELAISGCCCPPGQMKQGLHTNSTTVWWRVNDEPWQHMHRSMTHYRILAEAAETVEEFVEAVGKQ